MVNWAAKRLNFYFFLHTFSFDFSFPNAQNSLLFIKDEKGIYCLYWRQILALDSNEKDLNRWPKVIIISCKMWLLKANQVNLFGAAPWRPYR